MLRVALATPGWRPGSVTLPGAASFGRVSADGLVFEIRSLVSPRIVENRQPIAPAVSLSGLQILAIEKPLSRLAVP
jgi:hypothetical protein